MLKQSFNFCKDMHMKVLAVVKGLAASVLASGHVELILSVIVKFMIGVERAKENLYFHLISCLY